MNRDPSLVSYYIDAAYYDRLVARYTDWQRDERLVADPAVREACTAALLREARLLDERRYDAWLAMFTPECLYWIPGAPDADPRREVAFLFDDRRGLEGRIFRLATGYAWSQIPASRTTHMVANVEVFAGDAPDAFMVRSNLLVAETRAGQPTRVIAGWCAHRLVRSGGALAIDVKQVNLLECDRAMLNPSLVI